MGKKNDIVLDFLSDSKVFASLFNGYLFDGEQIIQPDALKEIDRKVQVFLTSNNEKRSKDTFEVIKRERDIVREVMIGDIPIRLTVLGIEHQSEVDYSMVLRVLVYDTLEYLKQAKKIEKYHTNQKDVVGKEYLSKFTKEDRLIPTITLVFYTGIEAWDAAVELKQLFVETDCLCKAGCCVGNWPLNMISVYDVDNTEKYHGDLKKIFDLLKFVNDGEAMFAFVQEHQKEYSKLDEATRRVLSLLTEMEFYIKGDETEEVPEVCKALEDIKKMGEREGIAIGEARGEAQGEAKERANIVLNMFKKGMSCEDISSLTDISLELIQEIVGETCLV